jgi:predicted RNA-binding protein
MNYKDFNYHSWIVASTVDVNINNNYIENMYLGIDNIDNHLYVLINRDGTKSCINYMNTLKQNKNYVLEKNVDLDLTLLVFKINNYLKDYNKIINGKFDQLSEEYIKYTMEYLTQAVINTIMGFVPHYEMLKMILFNNPQLLEDYWENIVDADDWLLDVITEKGVYFSCPSDQNLFNKCYKFSNN